MTKIGYARVSTEDQHLDLQIAALKEAGCATIFTDKLSGASADRPGLKRALEHCREGDVLVVWKLDRLGRSLFDLVGTVTLLSGRQAGLRVLTGQGAAIDTTRAEGRLIFGIFAALAEFERELIRERTKAGMEAARRRGVRIGRPSKLAGHQIMQARAWLAAGEKTIRDIAGHFGVHPNTLRRALAQRT